RFSSDNSYSALYSLSQPPTAEISPLSLHDALPISEPVKAPVPPQVHVPDAPWHDYASQDELPFTHSIEDIAANRNARDNQADLRSEEHTSELQSRGHLVCRLLLEKKKISTATPCHA